MSIYHISGTQLESLKGCTYTNNIERNYFSNTDEEKLKDYRKIVDELRYIISDIMNMNDIEEE